MLAGGSTGGDNARRRRLGGASERLVSLEAVDGVLPLPARAAEVLEAFEVPAEVRADHTIAHGAEGVLQVGVDLDLGRERNNRQDDKTVYIPFFCKGSAILGIMLKAAIGL